MLTNTNKHTYTHTHRRILMDLQKDEHSGGAVVARMTGWMAAGEAAFHDKSFVHATQAPRAPAEDQGLNYSERKS